MTAKEGHCFATGALTQRAAGGEDDRHGQSRRHLGEPLSPGRGRAIIPIDAHSGRDLGVRA